MVNRAADRPALRVASSAKLEGGLESGYPIGIEWEREALKIRALEALKRRDEAQEVRWRLFERTLNADMLRANLRALPDFEDVEALDRAFALASAHSNVLLALGFFSEWPNLNAAARLVLDQADRIDGRHYDLLTVAAEALAHAHPLAATLLYRKMIDSVLDRATSKAYAYAAGNPSSCTALASRKIRRRSTSARTPTMRPGCWRCILARPDFGPSSGAGETRRRRMWPVAPPGGACGLNQWPPRASCEPWRLAANWT